MFPDLLTPGVPADKLAYCLTQKTRVYWSELPQGFLLIKVYLKFLYSLTLTSDETITVLLV